MSAFILSASVSRLVAEAQTLRDTLPPSAERSQLTDLLHDMRERREFDPLQLKLYIIEAKELQDAIDC